MIGRRRLFAMALAAPFALVQSPYERHNDQPPMTPQELTDEVWQLRAVVNTHGWMNKLHNSRLEWLEKQILTPGCRVEEGLT